ncbi:PREDICTED: dnaJ homolog subfamily C member 3-like [Rhagoletis zephyria]|uniref:dnaJ homolog subfamily C member 3-like n=1 Tax=Rhagoletis zephyria TaxID=28612 RepID=UPI0008118B00|nr:PREDICTED: dnaJ homolog subfamily C member 3-like [Rhagoletis zephyria]
MNDQNKEETSRYVALSACDLLIDSDYSEEHGRDLPYSKNTEHWSKLGSLPFLDSSRSTFVAADVNLHLETGMQMLMKGQLNDALSHYHLAVESDPKNYLTYFKRSTVYQAMGRYKSALDDLTESLNLNPDFSPARLQKAIVLYRQGNLDEAHIDFEHILRADPYHAEANQYYAQIETLRQNMYAAQDMIDSHNWPEAVDILSTLVQELYWSYKLKEMRAFAFEQMGDIVSAINDLRTLTRMKSDNTDGFYKLSKLHYSLGEPEESLNAIRECLKLDPDHKKCHDHYKKVKKLANLVKSASDYAAKNEFGDCVEKSTSALKVESSDPKMVFLIKSKMCHCLNKNGNSDDAVEVCTEAHKLNPDDPYVLCDRADAYINAERFDEAATDYQKAHQIDENMTRAKEGYSRAQKLKKQSKKRDYYKILGVSRSASKKEIMRAYRKLASKWHPDQYHGDEKQKAEKMFIDIASAKEVLTNAEKRQKFDNGEDPLDPEQQNGFSGQGFNPFAQGFDPFGGRYSFKFSF